MSHNRLEYELHHLTLRENLVLRAVCEGKTCWDLERLFPWGAKELERTLKSIKKKLTLPFLTPAKVNNGQFHSLYGKPFRTPPPSTMDDPAF